jgi:chromosome partitioning protein
MKEDEYFNEKGEYLVKTLYDVFKKYSSASKETELLSLSDVIQRNVVKKGPPNIVKLHLVPSDLRLIDADREFTGDARAVMLKKELEDIVKDYDYIIIDCPPNLSLLTRNALFASDYCIIPLIPDFLSTSGLHLLIRKLEDIEREHERIGKKPVKIGGVLFTRVKPATKLHRERMSEVKGFLEERGISYFSNYIRDLIGVAEAAGDHLPLCADKKGNKEEPARDYRLVTEEFIKKIGER